jgi:hypothetical protein
LKCPTTYFYRTAFDPTLSNKQDANFNGDFRPFVIGMVPASLNLPPGFISIVIGGLEGVVISTSFSPSFDRGPGGFEGPIPARVRAWQSHEGTLEAYEEEKRTEVVHPLNRAPGCEARGNRGGAQDYSEQDRLRAAATANKTKEERGQELGAALKEFHEEISYEDKSKMVRSVPPRLFLWPR